MAVVAADAAVVYYGLATHSFSFFLFEYIVHISFRSFRDSDTDATAGGGGGNDDYMCGAVPWAESRSP